jgi:hypothetical protein
VPRLFLRCPVFSDHEGWCAHIQPRLAALIFNAIVQKCRNGEVFVAADEVIE